eukprot:jgi/Botrbrau1/7032/Bobra.0165s0055.1
MQICHYDIKPGNVLLDKARSQAKVSDVGLSKVIAGSQASEATLRGTFQYMAPELVTYEHGITFAVDIYSFGIMMHELITGEAPDKRRGMLPDPRVPQDCPEEAVELYKRCIERDPAKRPTSAELVEALEAIRPIGLDGPRRVQTAPADTRPQVVSISAMSRHGATVDFPGVGPKSRPSPVPEQDPPAGVRPDGSPLTDVGSPGVGPLSSSAGTVTSSLPTTEETVRTSEEAPTTSLGTEAGSVGTGEVSPVPLWRRVPLSPFETLQDEGSSLEGAGQTTGDPRINSPPQPSVAAPSVEMTPSPFLALAGSPGGARAAPKAETSKAVQASGSRFPAGAWEAGPAVVPSSVPPQGTAVPGEVAPVAPFRKRMLPSPFEECQDEGSSPEGRSGDRPGEPRRHLAAVAPPVEMIPSPFLALAGGGGIGIKAAQTDTSRAVPSPAGPSHEKTGALLPEAGTTGAVTGGTSSTDSSAPVVHRSTAVKKRPDVLSSPYAAMADQDW